MSLADLRKELKNLRKEAMPTPVSRMQKTAVAMELERLRGRSVAKVEVPSAPAVLEKIAKPIAEKKEKVVEKKEKVAEKPKAEKKPVVEKEEKYVPSKFVKGSQEAKDRMAEIRSKKGKKTE